MITKEAVKLAKRLWDYHQLNQSLEKVDCILVLGSNDLRVAERGAELFLQGWAPVIIFSGGLGRITKSIWNEPEARKFATIALNMGVPTESILIEDKSTNTNENIVFTQQLLEKVGLFPQKIAVIQKPYMERRSYLSFKKYWPDKELFFTSPQILFENYPNEKISLEDMINLLVGEVQRIKVYPKKGFIIFQEIPNEILKAYDRLVELGFNQHLVK